MPPTLHFANPRVRRRARPVFSAYLAGGGRRSPGAAGDVYDLAGGRTGVRAAGVTWADGAGGKALACDGTGGVTFAPPAMAGASASLVIRVRLSVATPVSTPLTGLADTGGGSGSATNYPWTDGKAYVSLLRTARVDGISLSAAVDRTKDHCLTVTTTPGGQYRVYQDAVQVASVAAESSVVLTTLVLGAQADLGFKLLGLISDAHLFDYELGPAEVARIAADPGYLLRPAFAPPIPAPAGRLLRVAFEGGFGRLTGGFSG